MYYYTKSIKRFLRLVGPRLIASLDDSWKEAKGERCSYSCLEHHTYDKYCTLNGLYSGNYAHIVGEEF